MLELNNKVTINDVDAQLYITASLDSRVLWRRKAHSLTRGFMEMLWSLMTQSPFYARGMYPRVLPITDVFDNSGVTLEVYTGHGSLSTAWVDTVLIGSDEEVFFTTHGLEGLTVDTNGVKYNTTSLGGAPANHNWYRLVRQSDGQAETFGGAWDGNPACLAVWTHGTNYPAQRSNNFLTDARIYVGYDNTAVLPSNDALGSQYANAEFEGSLVHGPMNVAPPVVSENDSIIALSRDFTNTGNNGVVVNESGLFGSIGLGTSGDEAWANLARDLIGLTIPSGSTINIQYEIRVACPFDSGGIMAQFNELLYRRFAETSREVKGIDNSNMVTTQSHMDFFAAGAGGGMLLPQDYASWSGGEIIQMGENLGPVVGTVSSDVSNTDYALNTQVPHGEGDGELFYYGVTADAPEVLDGVPITYFDLYRLYENRGSTNVVVNEAGLYVGAHHSGASSSWKPVMISRVLPSPVTVAPGEVLKQRFRLEAVY